MGRKISCGFYNTSFLIKLEAAVREKIESQKVKT